MKERITIKKKSLHFILTVLVLLLTSACTNGVITSSSQDKSAEPFRVALDELMLSDTALNNNMEYISLVLNEGVILKDSEKKAIEEYLQKEYKVKIYNYTYDQLMEKKLHDPNGTRLNGILLTIEKQEQSENENEMIIEVSKYRANEGAIALEMILDYQEGEWKVVDYITMRQS